MRAMSSWCAATIRANATSSPAMASSTFDRCVWPSPITTPIMLHRCHAEGPRYTRYAPRHRKQGRSETTDDLLERIARTTVVAWGHYATRVGGRVVVDAGLTFLVGTDPTPAFINTVLRTDRSP